MCVCVCMRAHAISFLNSAKIFWIFVKDTFTQATLVCSVAQSCLTLCDPRDWLALKALLSMGFPRQEYWSRLPFLSPRDLSDLAIEPGSPALQADSLPYEPAGKPFINAHHDNLVTICHHTRRLQYCWPCSPFCSFYSHNSLSVY